MVFKDRVKEITRTVGTVDYDVDGAYATFQGFNAFTDGDETYYCCDDGTNCEIGKGTISSSGTKVSRDEIVFSTNNNNLIDWGVGDKTIFCVFPSVEIMGLLAAVLNIVQGLSGHTEADNPHGINVDTIGVENIMSAIDSALGSTDWRTGGGGGGAGQTETTITQATHGLSVLNVVRPDAGVWSKAKADDVTTLGLGLVVSVGDANTFTVAMSGFYELTAHGLTVDEFYYLSGATAGELTATEPEISQPVLYVVDANNIVVLPYRPIGSGGGWDYTSASDPTISTNPATYPVSWLNTITGEDFVCTDNTTDNNVWVGNNGTIIDIQPTSDLSFYVREFSPSFGEDVSGNMRDFRTLSTGRRAMMSNGIPGFYMSGGAADGIEAANSSLTLPQDMTLSVWCELEDVSSNYAAPLCLGDTIVWVIIFINQTSRTVTFGCDDNVASALATTTEVIPLNTPTHIALVLDFSTAGKAYLYINGVKSSAEASISSIVSSTSTHGIRIGGRYGGGSSDGFWGIVARPSVYNRVLTQGEIAYLHAEGI